VSNTSVPAAATGLPATHRLGARIVVELTGTITSRDSQTDHYSIQPDDPRSSPIHVKPEYIFPEDDAPDAATGLPSENTAFTRADTSTHLAALEQRVQDAEAGWRREAEARKAAEQRAAAAERKLARTAPETCAIHAALRPMESPLSHADWSLTVLDLAFGHNRDDANGEVDQEWTALGVQVGEALVFVRKAREQFEQAWEAARGDSEPAGPADEPEIAVTAGGRAYLLLQAILDGLDIEGDQATFTITPEMADELAAFGAEAEDLEPEPDEDSHDREADVWHSDDQSDERAVQVQFAGRLEPRERPTAGR
jgi:hypothetical protein